MKAIVPQQMPLLEALIVLFPQNSKTSLRSWIKLERITVDGKVISRGDQIVNPGQVIYLGARPKMVKKGIKILYEDSHIVVIEKPAGILTVATRFEKGDTAHAYLKEHFKPRPVFVVHRLDQDTSGVMLFALSEKARDKLKEMFEKHDLERGYAAIVEGQVKEEKGTWKSYLVEDSNYHVHTTQNPHLGQLAITHFSVKKRSKRYTWLELSLETGKKNQIRVHCQAAGHSVVGDIKYGSQIMLVHRLCLHARWLAFNHPITHKRMCFESLIPDDFYELMGENEHASK